MLNLNWACLLRVCAPAGGQHHAHAASGASSKRTLDATRGSTAGCACTAPGRPTGAARCSPRAAPPGGFRPRLVATSQPRTQRPRDRRSRTRGTGRVCSCASPRVTASPAPAPRASMGRPHAPRGTPLWIEHNIRSIFLRCAARVRNFTHIPLRNFRSKGARPHLC